MALFVHITNSLVSSGRRNFFPTMSVQSKVQYDLCNDEDTHSSDETFQFTSKRKANEFFIDDLVLEEESKKKKISFHDKQNIVRVDFSPVNDNAKSSDVDCVLDLKITQVLSSHKAKQHFAEGAQSLFELKSVKFDATQCASSDEKNASDTDIPLIDLTKVESSTSTHVCFPQNDIIDLSEGPLDTGKDVIDLTGPQVLQQDDNEISDKEEPVPESPESPDADDENTLPDLRQNQMMDHDVQAEFERWLGTCIKIQHNVHCTCNSYTQLVCLEVYVAPTCNSEFSSLYFAHLNFLTIPTAASHADHLSDKHY